MYAIEKITGGFKVSIGNFETKEEAEQWLDDWFSRIEQSLFWKIWYFFPKRRNCRIVETEEPSKQEVALRINLWIPIAVFIAILTFIRWQTKGVTLFMSFITAVGILGSMVAAILIYMLFWCFLLFKLPEYIKRWNHE